MYRLLVASVLAWPLPLQAQDGRNPCPSATQPDQLAAISDQGDLVLRQAGLARLAGVRLPEQAPDREAALGWLRQRLGGDVVVHAGGQDRWSRRAMRVVATGGQAKLDLSHGLLERGLALVDAGPEEAVCLLESLALEATARERGLGVWRDDGYKPVSAGDLGRLRERIGRFILVEGRVRSVGERQQQTYLNFGTDWASDFTVIVPKPVWSMMQQRGLGASALTGRRVRSRGMLEDRQGPVLTIARPEAIEVLDHRWGPP